LTGDFCFYRKEFLKPDEHIKISHHLKKMLFVFRTNTALIGTQHGKYHSVFTQSDFTFRYNFIHRRSQDNDLLYPLRFMIQWLPVQDSSN